MRYTVSTTSEREDFEAANDAAAREYVHEWVETGDWRRPVTVEATLTSEAGLKETHSYELQVDWP